MQHTDFTQIFRGARITSDGEQLEVRVRELGALRVISGRITACDPLSITERPPFSRRLPPGEYPVLIAVAHFTGSGDQRVAAAMLRLAERPAVRWELATCDGQDLAQLPPGRIFGYGIDGGTGCFADLSAAGQLDDDETRERFVEALLESSVSTWSGVNFELGEANVVAFSSGWGDGFYASYWGFDEAGEPVALATDFGILVESIDLTVLLPLDGPFDDPRLAPAGVTVCALKRRPARYVLTATRSCQLELVDAAGVRVPVGYSVEVDGDTRYYEFDGDSFPKGTQLKVEVLLGFRPLPITPAPA